MWRLVVLVLALVVGVPASLSAEASSYDPVLARHLVLYAFAAYQSPSTYETLLEWDCPCCHQLPDAKPVGLVNDTAAQLFGFVARDTAMDATVVSFRGTVQNLENWLEDLHVSKTTPYPWHPEAKVHKGFFDAYSLLRAQVHALVEQSGSSSVYVTGHSLGASLAQLCALDLQLSYPSRRVTIVSYGTPRTGNSVFSSFYDLALGGRSVRVVHWKDVVPGVPLKAMGFYHTGKEAFYSQSFELLTFCEQAEDPRCSDGVLSDSISDHLMYFNLTHHLCQPDHMSMALHLAAKKSAP